MDSFFFALTAVFPLFALMAAGYLFRLKGVISENFITASNKIVFRFALPILLFDNVYTAKVVFGEYAGLIGFAVGGVCLVFLVFMIAVPLVVKENSRRGVIIQGLFRSNFVLLGTPLALNMFGSQGVGPASALIPIVVPLFNFFAVIALAAFSLEKKESLLRNLLQTLKGIVTNPLILASLAAILFVYLHIELPDFIKHSVSDIGKLATPLALVTLGGSFAFKESAKNTKAIIWTTLGRLAVIPAMVLTAAVFVGFRGASLGALVSVFATPIAVSSYIMAFEAGSDADLAGQLVVYTTALCSITLFLVIFVLRSLALL